MQDSLELPKMGHFTLSNRISIWTVRLFGFESKRTRAPFPFRFHSSKGNMWSGNTHTFVQMQKRFTPNSVAKKRGQKKYLQRNRAHPKTAVNRILFRLSSCRQQIGTLIYFIVIFSKCMSSTGNLTRQ